MFLVFLLKISLQSQKHYVNLIKGDFQFTCHEENYWFYNSSGCFCCMRSMYSAGNARTSHDSANHDYYSCSDCGNNSCTDITNYGCNNGSNNSTPYCYKDPITANKTSYHNSYEK